MKPFVIAQHEKDRANIRQLRATELAHVGGGRGHNVVDSKMTTTTVTRDGWKDDGNDEG